MAKNYVGFDIRQSQVELTNRRLKEIENAVARI